MSRGLCWCADRVFSAVLYSPLPLAIDLESTVRKDSGPVCGSRSDQYKNLRVPASFILVQRDAQGMPGLYIMCLKLMDRAERLSPAAQKIKPVRPQDILIDFALLAASSNQLIYIPHAGGRARLKERGFVFKDWRPCLLYQLI